MSYFALVDSRDGTLQSVAPRMPASLGMERSALTLPEEWTDAPGAAPVIRTRPVRSREYLEQRLLEEVDRSRRYGRAFSLLVFEGEERRRPPAPEETSRTLDGIRSTIRASDIVGVYAPGTLVALLVETDAPGAGSALTRAVERLPEGSGRWYVTAMTYPDDWSVIGRLFF